VKVTEIHTTDIYCNFSLLTEKYEINSTNNMYNSPEVCIYHISWPIRRTFLPEKCDLNSTCVLCAESKYYFQTYKYPYIYYTTSLSCDSENNHEDDFSGSDYDFLGFYDE